jgi:hypothetical protein
VNRAQRRHPDQDPEADKPGHRETKENPAAELASPERTQDDASVRAKSTGHKKKTADKWNQ